MTSAILWDFSGFCFQLVRVLFLKFQLQKPSDKKNYITLDFRDSTLTYAQESIFSQINHRAIVWLADQSQRYSVRHFRH